MKEYRKKSAQASPAPLQKPPAPVERIRVKLMAMPARAISRQYQEASHWLGLILDASAWI
jgi:hypothetical protein